MTILKNERTVKCNYCGKTISLDMIGIRWDNGKPYECCTMCCGVGKEKNKRRMLFQ
jgi:hypothetical protein